MFQRPVVHKVWVRSRLYVIRWLQNTFWVHKDLTYRSGILLKVHKCGGISLLHCFLLALHSFALKNYSRRRCQLPRAEGWERQRAGQWRWCRFEWPTASAFPGRAASWHHLQLSAAMPLPHKDTQAKWHTLACNKTATPHFVVTPRKNRTNQFQCICKFNTLIE